MRLDPEEFQRIYWIFLAAILCFMIFAIARIAAFEYRRRHPAPRPPREPRNAAGSDFGFSGISAGDTTSFDIGTESAGGSDSGDGGGGDGGGGDGGGGYS